MSACIWKNYQPLNSIDSLDSSQLSASQAMSAVSAFDRGLQYGDGFFTTALIEKGKLLNWSAHLHRIQMSTQALGFPQIDRLKLERSLQRQFGTFPQDSAVCKLLFTRGCGGQGYQPPEQAKVQLLSYLLPKPTKTLQPLNVQLSPVILSTENCLAGIKHLNRLSSVLARKTLDEGFDEAIMLNAFGQLQCGTQANLYVVQNGQVFTPPVNFSGVAGTFRQALLDNSVIQQKLLYLSDLQEAQGVFFSNAVRGLQQVRRLDFSYCETLVETFNAVDIPQCLHRLTLPAGKDLSWQGKPLQKTLQTDLAIYQRLSAQMHKIQQLNALNLAHQA